MAFGKKKQTNTQQVTQQNVSTLASQALAKMRSTKVLLAMRLTGTSPILVHQFGEKALIEMLSGMVGLKLPRGNKDLKGEFEASPYQNMKGDDVIPCRLVKACFVEGAISTDGVASKAELKRGLRILGHTAPIRKAKKEMDVRLVRNMGGSPDVRARAIFDAGWTLDIVAQFSPAILAVDAVIAASQAAGATIGLCDFRPARGGEYGAFDVEILPDHEVARVLKECASPERTPVIPPELLTSFNALPDDKISDHGRKAKALINGSAHKRTAKTAAAE